MRFEQKVLKKVYEEVSLFKNLEIFWVNNIKQLLNEAVEYDVKNYADLSSTSARVNVRGSMTSSSICNHT